MKKIYFVNNYSGVQVKGLKDSVYLLREHLAPKAELVEENSFSNRPTEPLMHNYEQVMDVVARTKAYANQIHRAGDTPVMIAGDHSIGMASVAATAANYPDVGLVWIDAHADINLAETSPSGNLHGMPIASLLGIGSADLNILSGAKPSLKPQNIVYLGLRDLDPGEIEILAQYNIKGYFYSEIKKRGLRSVLNELKANWQPLNIHLSFDFDSMDPEIMPGVSVPVPDGFSESEAAMLLDFFRENYQVRSYDFVEYNAGFDSQQKSLKSCLSLISSITNA